VIQGSFVEPNAGPVSNPFIVNVAPPAPPNWHSKIAAVTWKSRR
jgi:hypothetical protein